MSRLRKPRAIWRWSSISPLIASVPPLLAPCVSKLPRYSAHPVMRVLPRRAISGIEHEANVEMIFSAIAFPAAWVSWWNAGPTCWAQCQVSSTSTCRSSPAAPRRACCLSVRFLGPARRMFRTDPRTPVALGRFSVDVPVKLCQLALCFSRLYRPGCPRYPACDRAILAEPRH